MVAVGTAVSVGVARGSLFMPENMSQRIWMQWMPVLVIIAMMLNFAFFLYQHALNIPYHDDILDVLEFLSNVVQSTELSHTVEIFFVEYNEHRTLASRVIYYLAYLVEGKSDFRTLTYLANLGIPLLLLTLYLAIRKHSHAFLILLPAALVLFQLRVYGLYFFSMSAFAYFFVYFYGFACIVCLRGITPRRFITAAVFALLGSFTLASGQLIWCIGLISLLHQTFILRRCSLAYPVCWLICAVLILAVWRIGYDSPHTMSLILQGILEAPVHQVLFFFTLAGSAVSDNNVPLAICAGAIMVCVFLYSTVRNIKREDISLELFAAYVLITILSITAGRASFAELQFALLSRYAYPSVLLFATTIVVCLFRMPERVGNLTSYNLAS
jgi:hypothetical protein